MIEKNTGFVKDFQFQQAYNYIGSIANPITATASLRAFNINAWDGPFCPKGSQLTIGNPNSINSFNITLAADLYATQTSISCDSINLTEDIASDSIIIVSQADWVANKYQRFYSTHLNMNFNVNGGSKNTNDYLGTLTQGTFTTDSGSILTSGTNKGNSWGGRYGMLNPTGLNFRIHEIKVNSVNNFPVDTTLTLSFWKKAFDVNGSANSTTIEIAQTTFAGTAGFNNGLQFNSGDISENGNSALATNDVLIPSIRQSKTQTGNKNIYCDIEIISSTYFQ